jgi:hypothetical protein
MTRNFDARILVMRFAYGPLFEARGGRGAVLFYILVGINHG